MQHILGLDVVSNKSEKPSGEKCGAHDFVASLWKVFVDFKDPVEFSPAKKSVKSLHNVAKGGFQKMLLCVSVVFVSNVSFGKFVPCLQRGGCLVSDGISEV